MKRDETVDVAKGLGILLVILGHLAYYKGIPFRFIFAFHMPLFFVLMGLIFPYSLSLQKYGHKAQKLLLSYYLFLFIGVFITFGVPGLRKSFALDGTAARFLLFEFQPECFHVGQLWFLIDSLMVITLYFLFSKLAFLPKKLSPKTKGVILTVVIFVLGVGGLVVFNKTDNAFHIPGLNIKAFMRPALPIPDLPLKSDTAVCALLFFYIGVLLNKSGFKNKIYGLKTGYKIGGIVLFGLITFAVSRLNEPVNICDCQFGNPVFYLVGSLSGTLMTILTACVLSRGFIKRLLAYIGQNSLLIFSVHSFLILIYTAIINRLFDQNYQGMQMPFRFALVGLLFVVLTVLPIVAAKLFVQQRVTRACRKEVT